MNESLINRKKKLPKVKINSELDDFFNESQTDWKKKFLKAAESNVSTRIHPVLKRPDKKLVTGQAFENPRFVEDIVRLIAADLYELPFIKSS